MDGFKVVDEVFAWQLMEKDLIRAVDDGSEIVGTVTWIDDSGPTVDVIVVSDDDEIHYSLEFQPDELIGILGPED